MDEPERLLDRKEVAKRLGISPFTAGHKMRAGELPAFKMGRLWRVREADLDAYIRELSKRGAAADASPKKAQS